MINDKPERAEWLHPLLSAGRCRSAFTTRGCVADPQEPYAGFNVCHYSGDNGAHVAKCLGELSEVTGLPQNRIVLPTQTHSATAVEITSIPPEGVVRPEADALVTRLRDVIIGVNTADCVPVVLLDPVSETIGVAHAGWRGAVGGIVENTLELMLRVGARVEDICFAHGPSICVDCFEVGEEVACRFPEEFVDRRTDRPRPHVNLQGYVRDILLRAGLRAERGMTWDESLCTRHNPGRYFSARTLGTSSGRLFTFARII